VCRDRFNFAAMNSERMSDFAILQKRSSIRSFRKNTFGAFDEFIPASYARFGSKAVLTVSKRDFRSTPVNGHSQDRRACLKGASYGRLSTPCLRTLRMGSLYEQLRIRFYIHQNFPGDDFGVSKI
jgi:hypothetical protein